MREHENSSTGPGRPREFDKAEALSCIMQQFWENGYEGTGLSDLLKATGLAKASLYAAYGNKQAMYQQALAHYERLAVDTAVQALGNTSRPPADRLHAFLSAPIAAVENNDDRRGCFLCNASADRAALDEETAELVRRGYDKMLKALEAVIAEIEAKEAQSKAALALTTYSGLRIMARSGVDTRNLKLSRDACMKAIHSQQ